MSKNSVVIGLLGTQLDSDISEKRWDHWRPTASLAMQKDLRISRFDLIYDEKSSSLVDTNIKDFCSKSQFTKVVTHKLLFEKPWDFESVYAELLNFAQGYKFDTEKEEYLIHMSTGTHVMQICLFLLVESRIIPAKLLQTGSSENNKVIGFHEIIDLDLSKYDKLTRRFRELQQEGIHYLKSGISTKNTAYNHLIEVISKVSIKSNAPILITGPSGVGKTRLAKLIYDWKKQYHKVYGKFVDVNCATLKGVSAMSTLFGHEKGSYTGAIEKRTGLLAEADGGLLFLDEIGELGLEEQAMLLRAIEDKNFYPLGSDKKISSNFQLICGTNANIKRMVKEGKFRADLLARIKLWSFNLPGLRDRTDDIEPNLRFELEKASDSIEKKVRMNQDAFELYLKKATAPDALWSGNFRDLSGSVLRMSVLSNNGNITVNDVNEEFSRLYQDWAEEKENNYPLTKK